jgi:hypothetical protein
MKISIKNVCFIFLFVSTFLSANDNTAICKDCNEKVIEKTAVTRSLLGNLCKISFGGAVQKFYKKCGIDEEKEPEIECKKCKQRVSLSYLSGWMTGAALRFAAGEADSNENIETALDDFLAFLANGSPDEVEDFMVSTANKLQMVGSECPESSWQKVSKVEKVTTEIVTGGSK